MTSAPRPQAAAGPGTEGTGRAARHHGEILQGVFLDQRRRPVHALVTLPMRGPGSAARFARRPGSSPDEVTVTPAGRTKARAAAVLAVRECAARRDAEPCGGELTLSGDLPVGLGMGSSTSDVIATVRAVADSWDVPLPPETIARIAVRAEGASDPLMHGSRALLFAQREGRVLEVLGSTLPPTVVVGCALAAGAPVDTLSLPALRHDEDLAAYGHLRRMLRRAVATADTALLGRVSTASARLRQRVLPHAEFPTLTEIAASTGAVGVQIAHSGNVAGILFDPRAPGLRHGVRRCTRALDREGITPTLTFTTFTSSPTSEEFPWTNTSRKPSAART
ncbi:GHMP kinase [Streptomyces sp. NPDC102406]|uniref:GHMP family kinase ATP-binding protein n=1 Tax=Streptomyces sp. NPDC102406 TaxID=3366171 RepID=UPI00380EC402